MQRKNSNLRSDGETSNPIPVASPDGHVTKYRWNPYSLDSPMSTPAGSVSVGNSASPHEPSTPVSMVPSPYVPVAVVEPIAQRVESSDDSWSEVRILVDFLRTIRRDSDITLAIARQQPYLIDALVEYLEANPQVTIGLCETDRGNVVAQTMEVVGAARSTGIAAIVLGDIERLALDKSGSVAIVRVFEFAIEEQRDIVIDFTLPKFGELAVHPFGNYVLQAVLHSGRMDVVEQAIAALRNQSLFTALTGNKFGSHVVEKFLVNFPTNGRAMREVMVGGALQFPDTVVFLVTNRYANYVVQSCLRDIAARDPACRDYCIAIIEPYLKASPYAYNIVKSWSVVVQPGGGFW